MQNHPKPHKTNPILIKTSPNNLIKLIKNYTKNTKIIYMDHATLRYLLTKKEAKPRLIRLILLLSEFNIKIKKKKGVENVVAHHLS